MSSSSFQNNRTLRDAIVAISFLTNRMMNPGFWACSSVICAEGDREEIYDALDHCPNIYNPGQADDDTDPIGNFSGCAPFTRVASRGTQRSAMV